MTCYSCHRGALKPVATPRIGGVAARGTAPEAEKPAAALPKADQIIDDYVRVLGGAAAIEKITSRVASGTISFGGEPIRIEVLLQHPDKQAVLQHTPAGDRITVFDGRQGWSGAPGRPARDMDGADLDAARMDADLQFPLHLRRVPFRWTVATPERRATIQLEQLQQNVPIAAARFARPPSTATGTLSPQK